MGFRPTAEIRTKLEEAAAASGLSLTQEIERRLERSFGEEENLRWAFEKILKEARRRIGARDMVIMAGILLAKEHYNANHD